MRSFNIGSREGKDPQNSAAAMGSRMLRNVKVREVLAKKLQEQHADKAFVIENLLHFAQNAQSERDRIRATELLGKILAMFKERVQVEGVNFADLIREAEENRRPVKWTDVGPQTTGTKRDF